VENWDAVWSFDLPTFVSMKLWRMRPSGKFPSTSAASFVAHARKPSGAASWEKMSLSKLGRAAFWKLLVVENTLLVADGEFGCCMIFFAGVCEELLVLITSSGLSVSARAIHRRSIGSEAEQRASAGCQGLSVLKGRACAGSRGLYRTRGQTVSPWVADWLSARCHVTAGVCDVADRENCNPDQGFGLRLSDLQRLSDN
jgi:hypothetical protein